MVFGVHSHTRNVRCYWITINTRTLRPHPLKGVKGQRKHNFPSFFINRKSHFYRCARNQLLWLIHSSIETKIINLFHLNFLWLSLDKVSMLVWRVWEFLVDIWLQNKYFSAAKFNNKKSLCFMSRQIAVRTYTLANTFNPPSTFLHDGSIAFDVISFEEIELFSTSEWWWVKIDIKWKSMSKVPLRNGTYAVPQFSVCQLLEEEGCRLLPLLWNFDLPISVCLNYSKWMAIVKKKRKNKWRYTFYRMIAIIA